MADVLGILASALQLVDLVATASIYFKDLRNAPAEQQKTPAEVSNPSLEIFSQTRNLSADVNPQGGELDSYGLSWTHRVGHRVRAAGSVDEGCAAVLILLITRGPTSATSTMPNITERAMQVSSL
ncbi:hypothetical protein DFH08DRAFT_968312 [Mycena albidolilacea]|uniref:Uncharacterized protein n=1 Tax=Mycena albidolilacea TaxID=1033008 RepID=A0AAD6ZJX7_9AGAR|nr:hypothetical protein DFH08DRAFT_968312 [Mycena albidolilacea]